MYKEGISDAAGWRPCIAALAIIEGVGSNPGVDDVEETVVAPVDVGNVALIGVGKADNSRPSA